MNPPIYSEGPLEGARAARDEAIDRVDSHAHANWKSAAMATGWQLARQQAYFTSADLADRMMFHYPKVHTHDTRALGPVMLRLMREGAITRTERVERSGRARNHHRPLAVWRSIVYRGEMG